MNNNINTLFVGKVLLSFRELDSTNNYALSLLSKNKPSEGTVISAWKQSDGRGQIGNYWESEAGKNITVSIVLYPSFVTVQEQFVLNQVISLGVVDFLSAKIDRGLRVKWPNDIYVGDKKIAGILIQNSLSQSKIQSSIAGIGINVNQAVFRSNAPNPTSLGLETSSAYELEELLPQLCKAIETRYLEIRSQNFEKVRSDYLNCLYRFQEDALYQRTGTKEVFSGKIVGLTKTGRLILDTKKGEAIFSLKEIKFL